MTWPRRNRAFFAAIVASLAASVSSLGAIYARVDIENVPVARLVANLEKELAANPKNADVHLRLARLYAMAYAANTTELPVAVLAGADQKPRQEVWFGHEPDLIPRKIASDVSRSEASKAFLAKSVEHYRKVIELEPAGLIGRIGYAWTLEQSGNAAAAIAEYRRVVDQAWPKEENAKFAAPGQRFYTEEAVRYLIPLLSAQRDADEIAALRAKAERLARVPRAITPVAIPLTDRGTAKSIVDLDASVAFDADGTGLRKAWTWISSDAAWLVYEPSARGEISSALQLFGDVTFWNVWRNGYEAMCALDDDGDGALSDGELRYLALWRDTNGDAISDRGEVKPLAEYGIVSLSCRATRGDGIYAVATAKNGVRFGDGRTRPTYDVILRRAISVSAPEPQ
jgi:tetratricopeptide (TPR) repeat protein